MVKIYGNSTVRVKVWGSWLGLLSLDRIGFRVRLEFGFWSGGGKCPTSTADDGRVTSTTVVVIVGAQFSFFGVFSCVCAAAGALPLMPSNAPTFCRRISANLATNGSLITRPGCL